MFFKSLAAVEELCFKLRVRVLRLKGSGRLSC